ncbi:MAG: hypothetical protein ABI921_00360, partial [Panacibacter sp.]
TQKFTFSNTAAPHDFIINTDILHKTDTIADLFKNHINKKKEELVLGNFMKKNPGLEHAGGVLRGGTFVLVYTSSDEKVVADFMLPYASVDKDIVPQPPVIKPMPLPEFPKYQIPKIFEKIPTYRKLIDEKALDINDKIKLFDSSVLEANTRIGNRLSDIDATKKLFDDNVKLFDAKIKNVDVVYTGKLTDFEKKLDYQGKIFNNIANVIPTKTTTVPGTKPGLFVGDKDISVEAEKMRTLTLEIEKMQPDTPERVEKEVQLAQVTNTIAETVSHPNANIDPEAEHQVKAIIFDAQAASNQIVSSQNKEIAVNTSAGVKKATLGIGTKFIRP